MSMLFRVYRGGWVTVVSLAAPRLRLGLLGGLLVCWKASIESSRIALEGWSSPMVMPSD